mgnify:CR=1 FL=1
MSELEIWEESQELLETDDEEISQETTIVEETDLDDGDININEMERPKKKLTSM